MSYEQSRAYHQLQKSNVICVPQLYGNYVLDFPKREHEGDRTVFVMNFEYIKKGKLLSEVENLRYGKMKSCYRNVVMDWRKCMPPWFGTTSQSHARLFGSNPREEFCGSISLGQIL